MKLRSTQLVAPFTLALDFSDGAHGVFDGRAYLSQRTGPLLDKLRDPMYFQRCFIDAGALCWPNGLELSPAKLHALSIAHVAA